MRAKPESMEDNQIPKYTVKQVAELTGVTRNQIRLWEHRFQLVEPHRADNGYRLYTDDDLKVIQYVNAHRQKGLSMGVILQTLRQDMLTTDKFPPLTSGATDPIDFSESIAAIANGDFERFEQILVELQAGKTFLEAVKENDIAILKVIGELEAHDKLPFSSSHIASGIIKRRIFSHIQNMGKKAILNPVIIAGAPNDHHEIGMLLCFLELVQAQVSVLYIGPHMPVQALSEICESADARAVIIGMTQKLSYPKAETLAKEFQTLFASKVPVVLGGYEASQKRKLFEQCGLKVFDDPEQVTDFVQELLQRS